MLLCRIKPICVAVLNLDEYERPDKPAPGETACLERTCSPGRRKLKHYISRKVHLPAKHKIEGCATSGRTPAHWSGDPSSTLEYVNPSRIHYPKQPY